MSCDDLWTWCEAEVTLGCALFRSAFPPVPHGEWGLLQPSVNVSISGDLLTRALFDHLLLRLEHLPPRPNLAPAPIHWVAFEKRHCWPGWEAGWTREHGTISRGDWKLQVHVLKQPHTTSNPNCWRMTNTLENAATDQHNCWSFWSASREDLESKPQSVMLNKDRDAVPGSGQATGCQCPEMIHKDKAALFVLFNHTFLHLLGLYLFIN